LHLQSNDRAIPAAKSLDRLFWKSARYFQGQGLVRDVPAQTLNGSASFFRTATFFNRT
jgi:hypothetical protein